jgi:hypothetical protein
MLLSRGAVAGPATTGCAPHMGPMACTARAIGGTLSSGKYVRVLLRMSTYLGTLNLSTTPERALPVFSDGVTKRVECATVRRLHAW